MGGADRKLRQECAVESLAAFGLVLAAVNFWVVSWLGQGCGGVN